MLKKGEINIRVIVAGGRDFNNRDLLEESLHRIFKELSDKGLTASCVEHSDIEIVSGRANGADKLGEVFAKDYNLKIKYFPANWDLYGKSAGYRRNGDMAKYAAEDNGVLVAFWDGISRGTKHMIDTANKNKMKVYVVNY